MESTTSSDPLPRAFQREALNRWKLETLTGKLGLEALHRHQQQSQMNQAAENRAVRKSLWGDESSEDEMGDFIGGDVNYTVQQSPAPTAKQSGLLSKILLLALGALGPAGAIAGYLVKDILDKAPVPPQNTTEIQQITNSESLEFRLLNAEDLVE